MKPDIRLILINALIADIATKKDVNELRSEMSELRREIGNEINGLRRGISELREEISSKFKWTIGTILTIWGATVIPILLKLVGAI